VPVRSATIDLDGTLADTVLDLHAACNAMLADLGRPARSVESVRSFVGQGMRVLVERCLDGEGRTAAGLLECGIASFRRHYAQSNGRSARLFPGARAGLDALRAAGLPLACVTNKPAEFTLPLLERLEVAGYFVAVVAGDTLPYKKPRPEPLLHACAQMGSRGADNVHIGDSLHDCEAAHAAGCRYFHVPYGYNDATEPPPVASGKGDALVSDLADAARRVAAINREQC
jgi:phosphoglycolate phosphatase